MLTERSIRRLSTQLSANLGLGIFSQDLAALADVHGSDIDRFVHAIFRAEGMNPEHVDRNLHRQVFDMIRAELSASQQEQSVAGT